MTKIREGMRVKGKVEGRWYAGEVAHVYSSGKLKIKFNDGDVQVLSPEDVKIAGGGGGGNTKKMKEGMRVRGKVDGEWYLGEVAKILSSGMVRVNFDDGDKLVLKPEDVKDTRGRLGHENKESTGKIKKGSLVSYKGFGGEVIQLKEDEGMAKVKWDDDGKSEWMDLDDLKLADDLDWGDDLKKYNFRECTDQVTKIMGKRDLAPSEMVKKIVVYADKHATV